MAKEPRTNLHQQVMNTYFLHPRLSIAIGLCIKIGENRPYYALHNAAIEMGISVSYVEQIARVLREHGILASQRGPGGGAYLTKPLEQITVIDLANAMIPEPDDLYEKRLFRFAKQTIKPLTLWHLWKNHNPFNDT